MADNLTMTPGAGATVATDDIAGVHYQRVKIHDATPDSVNGLVVDSSGAVRTFDAGVNTAARAYALSMTTTTQPIFTAGANLAARTFVHMQNRGANDVEIGFTTPGTLGQGTIIPSGQSAGFAFGPGLTVYGRTVSGVSDFRVMELA